MAKKDTRRKQLSRIDYDKLKRTAYEFVVTQGIDQKEVSRMLDISEPTISKWSTEGKWREERASRQQCHSTDADNTKQILKLISEKRLNLELDINDAEKTGDKEKVLALRKEARALSDEMSKHNKTLQTLDKENRITLGVYIDVFDDIFTSLRHYDEDLWNRTIDFQSVQVRKKTNEIG